MERGFFQKWLDHVSTTFFEDDFETYRNAVELPLSVITQTATLLVKDETALRQGFNAWVAMLRSQQATDMVRVATGVFPIHEDMITGVYQTNVLKGAVRIMPPFTSTMVLRRTDNVLRAVSVVSGMANQSWPIDRPSVTPPSQGT